MNKIKIWLTFAALLLCGGAWAGAGDVISFNFHQDDSGNKGPLVGNQATLAGLIPADHWNSNKKNIASGSWTTGSNSKTLVYNVKTGSVSDSSAVCSWSFSASHFYGGGAGDYSDKYYYMKCIAAPQAGVSGTETFSVADVPFTTYDAILYISNWNDAPSQNGAFSVNNVNLALRA